MCERHCLKVPLLLPQQTDCIVVCVCVCVANQTKKKDFPFCNRNVENWKQKMYSRNFGLEFEERPKREERRYKGRLNERLRFRVEG